jgi:hypothetical protein
MLYYRFSRFLQTRRSRLRSPLFGQVARPNARPFHEGPLFLLRCLKNGTRPLQGHIRVLLIPIMVRGTNMYDYGSARTWEVHVLPWGMTGPRCGHPAIIDGGQSGSRCSSFLGLHGDISLGFARKTIDCYWYNMVSTFAAWRCHLCTRQVLVICKISNLLCISGPSRLVRRIAYFPRTRIRLRTRHLTGPTVFWESYLRPS